MASHSRLSQEHQSLLALAEYARNDHNSLEALFIIQLLDHFVHQGPNGSHLCLVFNLLGPSVHKVVESCRMAAHDDETEYHEFLDPTTILKVSRQLLKAVAFMHKAGYAHGGKKNTPILAKPLRYR
jgi:serine/threonine-protein kinase SRPK3